MCNLQLGVPIRICKTGKSTTNNASLTSMWQYVCLIAFSHGWKSAFKCCGYWNVKLIISNRIAHDAQCVICSEEIIQIDRKSHVTRKRRFRPKNVIQMHFILEFLLANKNKWKCINDFSLSCHIVQNIHFILIKN